MTRQRRETDCILKVHRISFFTSFQDKTSSMGRAEPKLSLERMYSLLTDSSVSNRMLERLQLMGSQSKFSTVSPPPVICKSDSNTSWQIKIYTARPKSPCFSSEGEHSQCKSGKSTCHYAQGLILPGQTQSDPRD